jgi:hypothetical protein
MSAYIGPKRRQVLCGQPIDNEQIKRSPMLRVATVLAIILVLGSSALSASAFARGAGYGGGGGNGGFRGNHFGNGLGSTDGYGASGTRGEFREYGGRDVWGHWGTYYGPMIPMT